MASTGALKSLARLGYVRSIADQYEEMTHSIPDDLRGILGTLRSACDSAMACWDEMLTHHDFARIERMLSEIVETPLDAQHDILTFTAFGLCLLEDVKNYLSAARKRKAVMECLVALYAVHIWFAEDHDEECRFLETASYGAKHWNAIL